MEIYLLKDGSRHGPFLPFKLRELLEDKEYLPTDKGWIEGMDDWAPLTSIEAIQNWMPRTTAGPPPLPTPAELELRAAAIRKVGDTVSEFEARRVRAWLRWIARTIDEILWFSLLCTIGIATGHLGLWEFVTTNLWFLIIHPLLWVPLEALLLNRFTTTPGKWLLGIAVTDDLGQPLTYPAALKRSAIVFVGGNGLGLPSGAVLPPIQGAMAWVLYRRTGTTLWDRAASSQLAHTRPAALGIILTTAVFGAWLFLGAWIALTAPFPPDMPEKTRQEFSALRDQLETNKRLLQNGGKPL